MVISKKRALICLRNLDTMANQTTKGKKPEYKYRLIDIVQNELPKALSRGEVLLAHLEASGISKDQYYADRKIPYGSKTSIPSDRLFAYAQVFDCSAESLLNQRVKAASIRSKKLSIKTRLA